MEKNVQRASAPLADIRDHLKYDPETGVFTWIQTASARRVKLGQRAGSQDRNGYRRITFCGQTFGEHRLAWYFHTGRMPEEFIDHINGDPSDNRICNLRPASRSENGCNRGAANPSLPKGVYFDVTRGQFRALIAKNGRKYHLGYFREAQPAAEAYRAAAADLHGEFVRFE